MVFSCEPINLTIEKSAVPLSSPLSFSSHPPINTFYQVLPSNTERPGSRKLNDPETESRAKAAMSLFDSPLFDPRYELGVHALCLALAIVIVVLSIVRMTDPLPFTRGQIMGLSMVSRPRLRPTTSRKLLC